MLTVAVFLLGVVAGAVVSLVAVRKTRVDHQLGALMIAALLLGLFAVLAVVDRLCVYGETIAGCGA